MTIFENVVYIDIAGNLYAIDIYSGDKLWKIEDIGYCTHSPVVDENAKRIYVTAWDGPNLITAVDFNGKILWCGNPKDPDIYWPYKVEIIEKDIYVYTEQATCRFDESGKLDVYK